MLSQIRTPKAKQLASAMLARLPLSSYSSPGRFFRSADDRKRLNATYADSAQRLADELKLGDIADFLDLTSYDDDPDWTPFTPDWPAISRHLAKLSEEMADALPR